MQGAIIPSSNVGVSVLGWHWGALKKVNPSSRSDDDFCHRAFGFVSTLTATCLAECVMSWMISKWGHLLYGIETWGLGMSVSILVFSSEGCDERDSGLSHWDNSSMSGSEEAQWHKCVGNCWQILLLFLLKEPLEGNRKDLDTEARTGFES